MQMNLISIKEALNVLSENLFYKRHPVIKNYTYTTVTAI